MPSLPKEVSMKTRIAVIALLCSLAACSNRSETTTQSAVGGAITLSSGTTVIEGGERDRAILSDSLEQTIRLALVAAHVNEGIADHDTSARQVISLAVLDKLEAGDATTRAALNATGANRKLRAEALAKAMDANLGSGWEMRIATLVGARTAATAIDTHANAKKSSLDRLMDSIGTFLGQGTEGRRKRVSLYVGATRVSPKPMIGVRIRF